MGRQKLSEPARQTSETYFLEAMCRTPCFRSKISQIRRENTKGLRTYSKNTPPSKEQQIDTNSKKVFKKHSPLGTSKKKGSLKAIETHPVAGSPLRSIGSSHSSQAGRRKAGRAHGPSQATPWVSTLLKSKKQRSRVPVFRNI